MHYTAVEDLFIREEAVDNTACNVVASKTATEAAAMTASDIANGKIIRLTTAGTIGGTAYEAGDFLKASVASTTLTWAKATSSDIKGYLQSAVRDWKRWGRDHSKDLGIAAWAINGDKLGAGAATIELESSADGVTGWTVIASASGSATSIDKNGRLAFFLLPRSGIKQFVRVVVKTTTQFTDGTNALAPVLSVGLENDAEQDIDASMVQPKIG